MCYSSLKSKNIGEHMLVMFWDFRCPANTQHNFWINVNFFKLAENLVFSLFRTV